MHCIYGESRRDEPCRPWTFRDKPPYAKHQGRNACNPKAARNAGEAPVKRHPPNADGHQRNCPAYPRGYAAAVPLPSLAPCKHSNREIYPPGKRKQAIEHEPRHGEAILHATAEYVRRQKRKQDAPAPAPQRPHQNRRQQHNHQQSADIPERNKHRMLRCIKPKTTRQQPNSRHPIHEGPACLKVHKRGKHRRKADEQPAPQHIRQQQRTEARTQGAPPPSPFVQMPGEELAACNE